MADFTQTISNTLTLYAYEPTNMWGTMVWGVDLWTYRPASKQVEKVADNALGFDATYAFDATHLIENTLASDTDIPKDFVKTPIENSVSLTSDPGSEYLSDTSGYTYVFIAPATNAENRDLSAYTQQTTASASFSCATAGSTSWS